MQLLGNTISLCCRLGRTRRSGREVSDRYSILVVEDDALIAMELGERLADMGYDVLGPAATVAEAEAVVARKRPDAALLDSNLGGVSSTALAATLAANGVPLAFCTGYDSIKTCRLSSRTHPFSPSRSPTPICSRCSNS